MAEQGMTKIGRFDLVANEKWRMISYVNDGQRVIVPVVHDGKLSGLWCRVAVAAGYHARVVNEKFGIDGWVHIDDLRVQAEQETSEQVRT